MAIKGKKKNKSGHKPRPTAPKHDVVVPKQPLINRTWFQMTLVGIIVLLLGLGLGFGFGKEASTRAKSNTAAARLAAGRKAAEFIRGSLAPTGAAEGNTYEPFPDLKKAISNPSAKSDKIASEVRSRSSDAFDALKKLNGDDYKGGLTEAQVTMLQESSTYLEQSMRLFAQAATQLQLALTLDGNQKKQALEGAKNLEDTAQEVAGSAYNTFVRLLIETGAITAQEVIPPGAQPAGFPQGGLPPQGIPPGGVPPQGVPQPATP